VRVALKLSALFFVTALAAISAWLATWLTFGRLRPTAIAASRLCSWWSSAACRILGIRRLVRGAPRGNPFLVAANHLTYLDIWVLGSLYPSIFVAKREISTWPVFGWVARTAGTLFVDRGTARDVVRAGRVMEQHLRERVSLTVFPEGGTSHGEAVRPFLSPLLEPAARLGTPCFAASISYATPGAPDAPAQTICWSGGKPPFFRHLLGVLALRRIEAHVVFSAEPISESDRKELARRLEQQVRESFTPVRQRDELPGPAPVASGVAVAATSERVP
jgi:1-acyl-sn-glycerol-3-phosphate acyltransferase